MRLIFFILTILLLYYVVILFMRGLNTYKLIGIFLVFIKNFFLSFDRISQILIRYFSKLTNLLGHLKCWFNNTYLIF